MESVGCYDAGRFSLFVLQRKAPCLLLGLADLLAYQPHQLAYVGSLDALLLFALNVIKGRAVSALRVEPDVDAEHESYLGHLFLPGLGHGLEAHGQSFALRRAGGLRHGRAVALMLWIYRALDPVFLRHESSPSSY